MNPKNIEVLIITIFQFSPLVAQSNQIMDVDSHQRTYSRNVRGYVFTAPCDFIIIGLRVPTDIYGKQHITVAKFNTLPPLWSGKTNCFTELGRWRNVPGNDFIDTVIRVKQVEINGIYGQRGANTSYGPRSGNKTTIGGKAVKLCRSGIQHWLRSTPLKQVWRENAWPIGRVEMRYVLSLPSYFVDGNANGGSLVHYNGSGIYQHRGGCVVVASNDSASELSPSMKNCKFENNFGYYGAAIILSNRNGTSKSRISRCIFEQNVSEYAIVSMKDIGRIFSHGKTNACLQIILPKVEVRPFTITGQQELVAP